MAGGRMSRPTRLGDELADWKARTEQARNRQAPNLRTVPATIDPDVARADQWTELVGRRLANATPDTLDGDLARWVTVWLADPTPDLLFLGPVGSGKTWAATAAARERWMDGCRVEWWTAPSLLEAMRPDGDREPTLRRCQTADVLVVDDLGRDKPTDWTLEQLHLVLDHRHRHMLPTVVTSNWSPVDLPGRIGRQAASRLLGAETVGGVPSDGADRRMA